MWPSQRGLAEKPILLINGEFRPGTRRFPVRSRETDWAWIKLKLHLEQEFVIGGYSVRHLLSLPS
jgi:hypothetical protein